MLYIWMPEGDGVWKWSYGETWQEAYTLDQLIRALADVQGQDALVFFPSQMTQVFSQTLLKSQYQKMGQEAAQYLIEDALIHSIDQFKILQNFQAPETLHLLAISHQQVQTLQHALNLLPIQIVALLPDFLLLQTPLAQHIHIALCDGRYLIRESNECGLAVDDLSMYLNFQLPDQQYQLSGFESNSLAQLKQQYSDAEFTLIEDPWQLDKKLRQHAWNVWPKSKKTERFPVQWKACAALVAAIIVAQFSYDALRWMQNKKMADQTAQQAVEQYQSWFGAQGRVSEQNLKSQFESHLRQNQRAEIQSLDVLSKVGPLLMQHNIVAENLLFQDKIFKLSLKAQSTEHLQRLIEQMKQQGLDVELGRVEAISGAAKGEVKVQS